MGKRKLRKPFFVCNPKAYLYGDSLVDLAIYTDQLAKKYDVDVLFTAQHVDLVAIKNNTNNLIVTAQHMDGMSPRRGMGHILPDALANAGIEGVFLNHAEHPMSLNELKKAIDKANQFDIVSIVCADSIAEAKAVAILGADIIVCEPNELIGTGQTSGEEYILKTTQAIKEISPDTLVLQAAGISTAQDVYEAILFGADGTGGTSGIVCAPSPRKVLDEMFEAIDQARAKI